MNIPHYLILLDITTNKIFKKYFQTQFEKDKFRRRLRYSHKLLVKEESK